MTDSLIFCDDEPAINLAEPYIILISDDDVDVHKGTVFALATVKIHSRPLKFIHAYTGAETGNIVAQNTTIDLLLLDAVMENFDAGISAAKYIRETLGRKIPTIIMRSGFAGFEIEASIDKLSCIDSFILKSNADRNVLIAILEKWLPIK
jgi:CheY-like chemotaxis protein